MRNWKILPALATLVLLWSGSVSASQNRLAGMNGNYYIPDAEFDALVINPALLTRLSGTHIMFNGVADIYSSTKVHDEPFNYFASPTNNSQTTNTSSLDFHGSQVGVLSSSKKFAFGLLLLPDVYTYSQDVITDPNSKTNNNADTKVSTQISSGLLYNGMILLAAPLGNLSLGLSASYSGNPVSTLGTVATNIPFATVKAATTKSVITLDNFNFLLGGTFSDDKRSLFGLTGGYTFSSGLLKPSMYNLGFFPFNNYIATNDTWYLSNNLTGSMITVGVLLENKIGETGLLRNIASFQMSSSTSEVMKTDAFLRDFAATNMDYNVTGSDMNIGYHFAFDRTWERALAFIGFYFNYDGNSTTTSFDLDTKKPPAASFQQYKIVNSSTSMISTLTLGAEGSVLKWLVLRGGMQFGLFSYALNSSKTTDSWDAATASVKDTVIQDNQNSSLSIFNTCTISGGATLRFGPNVNLDIGTSMNILGLNVLNEQNQRDNTKSLQTPVLQNPVDTVMDVEFKANIGLTFLL